MRRIAELFTVFLLLTLVVGSAGCQVRVPAPWGRVSGGVAANTHLYAVLLNGGGKRERNYHSHLQNVKRMLELLAAAGVPAGHVWIFSSDGPDPAADLAVREPQAAPGFWLLPGHIARYLRPPITYANSAVEGFVLQPARQDALRAWFAEHGRRLRAGDTLLFYVTDHGHKNAGDTANNSITLWGEALTVDDLRELLAQLDPAVRVVLFMSQCYSGAFARAIFAGGTPASAVTNTCGYFASTAERPAYGCYPENRGKAGVGHSYEFFNAVADLGRFSAAHRRLLVSDRTPDVPHTSSAFFFQEVLSRAAAKAGRELPEFVDKLLREVRQDPTAWEAEIRLLDRTARAFGFFSPRSLAELEEQARVLPEFSDRLKTYAERWNWALAALKTENLRLFLEAHPAWSERLEANELKDLDAEQRRQTAAELLAELGPFAKGDAQRWARLQLLKGKVDDATGARYRAEVRLGAVLRLRLMLTSLAGRIYVVRQDGRDLEAAARLRACEGLRLLAAPPVASAADMEPPEPFPPLADEQQVVQAVMPAWMGIRYHPLPAELRERYGVQPGAVKVQSIYPDSPAEIAGLKAGDIILGPPGEPFAEPHAVREWTMRREVGEPAPLEVLRSGKRVEIALRPGPYPLAMPELPGPPKVGSAAPPLAVQIVRGPERLPPGAPRLLFFWASWCPICRKALPETLAFARARGVEIVAITDEDAETVRDFLGHGEEPFPAIVAIDPERAAFQSYGVSGTPTFVLVDDDGIVRHYQTGYRRAKGLQVEGWEWEP